MGCSWPAASIATAFCSRPAIAQEMADIILGKGAVIPDFDPQKIQQEFVMSEFTVDPVIQKLTYQLADWPLSRRLSLQLTAAINGACWCRAVPAPSRCAIWCPRTRPS
jgi:hypothetical protein